MLWRRKNKQKSEAPSELATMEGASSEATLASALAEPKPGAAGEQLESVIVAAERVAERIREDAQVWARQYREEARQEADQLTADRIRELAGLTDNLINRARTIAERSDDLITTLDDTSRRLLSIGGSPEAAALNQSQPKTEASEEKPAPVEATANEPVSEGARLLATQMAVAGGSRDGIAQTLRDEFGIMDPSPILDEIGI